MGFPTELLNRLRDKIAKMELEGRMELIDKIKEGINAR